MPVTRTWHDDRVTGGNINSGDTELASRIDSAGLHIHNQPGVWTRVTACRQTNSNNYTHTRTIIDLVLSSPPEVVADISQRHRSSTRPTTTSPSHSSYS